MRPILIVVPCYNEADRLACNAFHDFVVAHSEIGFIFVDDGSTDETARIIKALAASHPDSIQLIQMPQNAGKAEAVRRGMLQGFDSGAAYVGYWDADLATPLTEIPQFCRILESTDKHVVMGMRIARLGAAVNRKPHRHYLGRVFATAAGVLLRLPVYDTQCGAKLTKNSPAIRHCFTEPFKTRWIFDVEWLARLVVYQQHTRGADVRDVVIEYPLSEWNDIAGSKVRSSDFLRALNELRCISAYLRKERQIN